MGVAQNPETDAQKANVMTTEEKVKLCYPTAKIEDGWATVGGRKMKVRGVKFKYRWLVYNDWVFFNSKRHDRELWESAWKRIGYPLRREFRDVFFARKNGNQERR